MAGSTSPAPSRRRRAIAAWLKGHPTLRASALHALRIANETALNARILAAGTTGRPRVVHAHDLNTLTWGAALASWHGARLVYDAHELFEDAHYLGDERPQWVDRLFDAWHQQKNRAVEGLLIHLPDALITVSRGVGQPLVERYGVPAPTILLNAPSAHWEPVEPLEQRVGPGGPILLYLGGVSPGRGIEVAVRALPKMPGVRLLMVGPLTAPVLDDLLDEATELGVQDRVFHLPAVRPRQVVPLARAADVGIITTLPTCQNHLVSLPNKLFEYAFAGLPVISSDLPQLSEWLDEHALGLTFPAGDVDGFVAAATRALAGTAQRSDQQKQRFLEEMCWERQGEKLSRLYARLLGAPAGDDDDPAS